MFYPRRQQSLTFRNPTPDEVALHNAYNGDWYNYDAAMVRQCARKRIGAHWLTSEEQRGWVFQCEGWMSGFMDDRDYVFARVREAIMSRECRYAVIVDLSQGIDGPCDVYRIDHDYVITKEKGA